MKRIIFILALTVAAIGSIQAAHVNENAARQLADRFFSSKSLKSPAVGAQATSRLAYTAPEKHFYVFERGNSGFVVVAGDDRLPQVLGYSDRGQFQATQMPPAMQYWMHEMNRQIAFLQEHDNVVALLPIKHETAVAPLMTTTWDQGTPYNDLCPTYGENNVHCVTGCVATACAQVMNYHQWPDVGVGNHSYTCNVNGQTPVELSADFSQSEYQWDLMLDNYDEESSPESCAAVAKLMSDVGISMDMGYGASSGAFEYDAMHSMVKYFKYYEHCYLLERDYYSAAEWDQILVEEITAGRPIVYCGYSFSGRESGGHAFVLDGFDTDGYFHVNWGWGGSNDGYFLFTLLAPTSSMDFEYLQDGIFGLVPNTRGDEVKDVLYVHGYMYPMAISTNLGNRLDLMIDEFTIQGNKYSGCEERNGEKRYYISLPMSLSLFDSDGVERYRKKFNQWSYLDDFRSTTGQQYSVDLPTTLEDGEYQLKVCYSLDDGANYDKRLLDNDGNEVYLKLIVHDGIAEIYDCFLSNRYTIDSFDITSGTTISQPITVDTKMSYRSWGASNNGPRGNVYLALLNADEEEVSTSELYEVQLQRNTPDTYHMQIMAPDQMGLYDLAIRDEEGNNLYVTRYSWSDEVKPAIEPIFVLPICQQLVEDFESMTANTSTSAKNVQGKFTTWSFNKSGVRAPGEDRCHGTNSVMMKKPSTLFTTQALNHNFFMAQATFFNPATPASKYTLEYSTDGGETWQKAKTIFGADVEEVPEKNTRIARWSLDLDSSQPALFRIAMIGGGTASTYMDDFVLYYNDAVLGDVNTDGVVNIIDVNVVINLILTGNELSIADVNGDGVINIADVNFIIGRILK